MKERFVILCREPGARARHLGSLLSNAGEVTIVSDMGVQGSAPASNSEIASFRQLAGWAGPDGGLPAWELAWMQLKATSSENDTNVWLIEDHMRGSAAEFERLVRITRETAADFSARNIVTYDQDPHWAFWKRAVRLFPLPARSVNSICRLSSRLVSVVLEFHRKNRHGIFHEMLLASLAVEHGFSFFDWSADEETSQLVGSSAWGSAGLGEMMPPHSA